MSINIRESEASIGGIALYEISNTRVDRPLDPTEVSSEIDTYGDGCPNNPPDELFTRLNIGVYLQNLLRGIQQPNSSVIIVLGDGGVGRRTLYGAISAANAEDLERSRRTEDTQQSDYQEELKRTV